MIFPGLGGLIDSKLHGEIFKVEIDIAFLKLEMPSAMPGNFANQRKSYINLILVWQKQKYKWFLFLVNWHSGLLEHGGGILFGLKSC